ncbi:hypothetical protein, partial [Burkholderia anthina]|uniref:hypothetical protein n=1 Tax=Burkholderia anthina TaxID=179879 RepID=UPI001ABB80CA
KATSASARVAAFQICARSVFARPCCAFGKALSTLPILWNQQEPVRIFVGEAVEQQVIRAPA